MVEIFITRRAPSTRELCGIQFVLYSCCRYHLGHRLLHRVKVSSKSLSKVSFGWRCMEQFKRRASEYWTYSSSVSCFLDPTVFLFPERDLRLSGRKHAQRDFRDSVWLNRLYTAGEPCYDKCNYFRVGWFVNDRTSLSNIVGLALSCCHIVRYIHRAPW